MRQDSIPQNMAARVQQQLKADPQPPQNDTSSEQYSQADEEPGFWERQWDNTKNLFPLDVRETPMKSSGERDAVKSIREKLSSSPEALAEFEKLLESDLFTRGDFPLDNRHENARAAVLQQLEATPTVEVISNMQQLGDKDWFREQSTDDQLRTARLVAYNSSGEYGAAGGAVQTMLEGGRDSSAFEIKWDNVASPMSEKPRGEYLEDDETIVLDRSRVPAAPFDPSEAFAPQNNKELFSPNEHNVLTYDFAHAAQSIRDDASFSAELRGFFEGYKAQSGGHEPSEEEVYNFALQSLDDHGVNAFERAVNSVLPGEPFSRQSEIVEVMATTMGLDPETATYGDVMDRNNFQKPNQASERGDQIRSVLGIHAA